QKERKRKPKLHSWLKEEEEEGARKPSKVSKS
ncbi:unnamed protein product, partial [Cuscuta campestris]